MHMKKLGTRLYFNGLHPSMSDGERGPTSGLHSYLSFGVVDTWRGLLGRAGGRTITTGYIGAIFRGFPK